MTGLHLAQRACRDTSGHSCDCLLHAFLDEINRLEHTERFTVKPGLPRTAAALRRFFADTGMEYNVMACFWDVHDVIDVPVMCDGVVRFHAKLFEEFVQHHGQPNVFLSTIMMPFLAIWLQQFVVPPDGVPNARLLYFGCHSDTHFNEFQWREPPNIDLLQRMALSLTRGLESPDMHGFTPTVLGAWRSELSQEYPRNDPGLLDERVQSRLKREVRLIVAEEFGLNLPHNLLLKRSTAWEAHSIIPALDVRRGDVVLCSALKNFHFESCPPCDGRPLLPPARVPGWYKYHNKSRTVWMDVPRQNMSATGAAPMSLQQQHAAMKAQQAHMMAMIMQLAQPPKTQSEPFSITSSPRRSVAGSVDSYSPTAASINDQANAYAHEDDLHDSYSPTAASINGQANAYADEDDRDDAPDIHHNAVRASVMHSADAAVQVSVGPDGIVRATAICAMAKGDFVFDANVMRGIHGRMGCPSSPPTILGSPSMSWALYREGSKLWVHGAGTTPGGLLPNVQAQYPGQGGIAPPPVSTMRWRVLSSIRAGAVLSLGACSIVHLQVYSWTVCCFVNCTRTPCNVRTRVCIVRSHTFVLYCPRLLLYSHDPHFTHT